MENYSIEDIEFIRSKSNVSYEEAIALLEYHSGDVARVMIDLERKGKLNANGVSDEKAATKACKKQPCTKAEKGDFGAWVKSVLKTAYANRIILKKQEETILNLSLLACIIITCSAFWLVFAGIIVSLVLGYTFSYERHASSFVADELKRTVKNAAENVQSTVQGLVNELQKSVQNAAAKNQAAQKGAEANEEKEVFADDTAPVNASRMPEKVEFNEGTFKRSTMDEEGFTSITVE